MSIFSSNQIVSFFPLYIQINYGLYITFPPHPLVKPNYVYFAKRTKCTIQHRETQHGAQKALAAICSEYMYIHIFLAFLLRFLLLLFPTSTLKFRYEQKKNIK